MKPRKVLVVDDSKLMHKIYAMMLRDTPLISAADGREALNLIPNHPDLDLILLDINMPNMSGLEFLSELRAANRLAPLRVIVVSTEGREEDAARGIAAGASAYIRKPFRSEELLEVINLLEASEP